MNNRSDEKYLSVRNTVLTFTAAGAICGGVLGVAASRHRGFLFFRPNVPALFGAATLGLIGAAAAGSVGFTAAKTQNFFVNRALKAQQKQPSIIKPADASTDEHIVRFKN